MRTSPPELTALRLKLLAAGFIPIPLYGKEPPAYGKNNKTKGLTGWQKLQDVSAEQIRMWGLTWPDADNTGVLTAYTPTIDIDIKIEEAAEAVEDLARKRFEDRGCFLVRIGQAPKRAIPLRGAAPFSKITANVVAPDGSTGQKIELLCDRQQVVVAGIHPDTRKPYRWHGGELGDIKHDDLPAITEAEAHTFVADAVKLLEGYGYKPAAARPKDKEQAGNGKSADWGYLTDNIRTGNELHDSITPLAAKLIVSGMSQPAAINFLRSELEKMPAPHDDRWRERYDEIPRAVASAVARFITEADGKEPGAGRQGVSLEDFYAYMPMHNYIYAPAREPWPASSVNARIPPVPLSDAKGKPVLNKKGEQVELPASAWLDQHRPVEMMTWAPGLPMIIRDRLISLGGWINRKGVSCFNLYRPPHITPGDATQVGPWLNHAGTVFGDDAEHILMWLAHRVQRPQEKINHALVLGGHQGIGKDTLLEPVKRAVGPWNFNEVSPQHMLGRFNGFLKSVILRVSEGRDLGDVDRFAFYDHMKAYTAAPPDVLRVDEKNLREHSIINCCGVIITTNHKTDGIYLPADDRRHFVAWAELTKDDFTPGYWNTLWGWYASGGDRHVAAYLAELDLAAFDPKAPPPKTAAFWDIVNANQAPEDSELADVLDQLGNPDATTITRIIGTATGEFLSWISDRKNRRVIPHRLEKCGYVPVRNDAAQDGQWKIHGKRQAVYAKSSLSIRERLAAASKLT
jgi:Family of unknown function (DUF5906)/Bifunctional DNA primase/polymerase, N-terminal